MRHVEVFDTTLRDGEQSPGASLTSAEKVEIARQLSRLGVDIIDGGDASAHKAEIDELDRALTVQNQVAWFDISMDQIAPMRMPQSSSSLQNVSR